MHFCSQKRFFVETLNNKIQRNVVFLAFEMKTSNMSWIIGLHSFDLFSIWYHSGLFFKLNFLFPLETETCKIFHELLRANNLLCYATWGWGRHILLCRRGWTSRNHGDCWYLIRCWQCRPLIAGASTCAWKGRRGLLGTHSHLLRWKLLNCGRCR